MIPRRIIRLAGAMALLLSAAAIAQNYDLTWHTIDGGGGTSSGGTFSISGTIGQPDAQTPPVMSGGAFELAGGFWPAAASICTLPGDLNHDGRVDGDDIQLFVNCVVAGTGACACADFDGNGINGGDVPLFVAAVLGQ
jgi:hypothetical protein